MKLTAAVGVDSIIVLGDRRWLGDTLEAKLGIGVAVTLDAALRAGALGDDETLPLELPDPVTGAEGELEDVPDADTWLENCVVVGVGVDEKVE